MTSTAEERMQLIDKIDRTAETAEAVRKIASVRRRDGYYRYKGEKFVSVTEVLKALAKPALVTWAARTAASLVLEDPEQFSTAEAAAGGIYRASDRAKKRGSRVHAYADGSSTDLEGEEGYAIAYECFRSVVRPEPVHTECNVYSRTYGYAGTTDLIATIGGETWLLDYKTSKDGRVYDEAKLQLAAYAAADFILPYGPHPEPVPMPAIAHTGVVALCEDGTWSLTETHAPLEVFLALMQVWTWMKGNR